MIDYINLFPALANPAPPVAIPPPKGKVVSRFNAAEEFAALAAKAERGEFRLRAPAATTAGLIGPFRGHGDCLVPVFHSDLVWIDPSMPAQDGDFVIVAWHPEKLRGIVERGNKKPEWLAMYGPSPGPLATKWLRAQLFDYWTVCRESMLPLDADPFFGGADTVLGVIRYVERDGKPIYGSGEIAAPCLNPEAATEVFQLVELGSAVGDPVEDEIAFTVSTDCVAFLEARCNSCTGGGAGIANWTPYADSTDGQTIDCEDGSGNPISFPIVVASFPLAAGAHVVGMRADASSAGNVTINDRYLTVTLVKR